MNNRQRMTKNRSTKNVFAELFANDNMAQNQPMSKPADNMRNNNQHNRQPTQSTEQPNRQHNRQPNQSTEQPNERNITEQPKSNPKRKSKSKQTSNNDKKHYFIGAKLSKNLSKKPV